MTIDIDKLEAGREMDALVAERVMGKLPCNKWKRHYGGWGMAVMNAGPLLVNEGCEHDNCYAESHPSAYSTDIKAAWSIIHHLESGGFIVDLFDRLGFEELENDMLVSMWRCEFMDEGAHAADRPRAEIWKGVAQAETAPLAICRAALKAIIENHSNL